MEKLTGKELENEIAEAIRDAKSVGHPTDESTLYEDMTSDGWKIDRKEFSKYFQKWDV